MTLRLFACLLATVAMFSTPALGGEWCETFESGPGTFWTQPESQGGLWQHTSYANETRMSHRIPPPTTGEDGMMLLRGDGNTLAFWSMLVSPELEFTEEAAIQLQYWLSLGSQPSSPVSFMIFRRVNGVDDSAALLDITNYVAAGEGTGWMSIEVSLGLQRPSKVQVVIYGYLSGADTAVDSNIGLDRITVRGVSQSKSCGEEPPAEGAERPVPTPQAFSTAPPPVKPIHYPDYDFYCPEKFGLFLDPSNCNRYYSCADWEAHHMSCPSMLAFSQHTGRCEFPRDVPGC